MSANASVIQYEKFKLSNGIKCVLYPRKEIHSVSVRVIVNVGSLDENETTNGLSHFIEHVVHDGTEELQTWDAVDEYTNKFSGSTNAFTSIDHTQYYGTFPSQYLEEALVYFSQVVLHPLHKPADVQKERIIILDELKRGRDEIDYAVYRNIKDNRFTDSKTQFSYDIIGTKPLLERYSQKDLMQFYKKFYTPENIEIYIVGNLDVDECKKLLEKHFKTTNSLGEKPERSYKNSFPDYAPGNIKARKKLDITQYYLTLTFPSYEFSNTTQEKRTNESFLRSITASSQYFQSVLWKRLREELGIVYGVGSYSYDMNTRAMNIIQTSFDEQYLEVVLREMKQGLDSILNKKIASSVFDAKKKRIVDTQLMQLDSPQNVLNWIVDHETELDEHGRALTIGEYLKYVDALKFEDILETAEEIYDWKNVNIGIVSQNEPGKVEEMVTEIWRKL